MMPKETPLMKQYNCIKQQYPGALLLFRVGDFYETFGKDAIQASKILGIVLTKRSNGAAASIELAGFPYHALDTYLPKLVKAGHRVAICDQLEDPKMVKGIVKRGVTELVTPGLAFSDHVLDQKTNNYLASIHFHKEQLGIAFLDLSTGEFLVAQGEHSYIDKLLQSFNPSEVICLKKEQVNLEKKFKNDGPCYCLEDWVYHLDYGYEMVNNHFGTTSLKGFGIEELPLGIIAAGAILRYLEETAHKQLQHITAIARIEEDKYVWLDHFTIKNLELLVPQQEGGVSLLEVIDKTITPMGGRLIKKWVTLPLKSVHAIQQRLDMVALLANDPSLGAELSKRLRCIGDIERLISKVAVGRVNPREMLALGKSLQQIIPIQQHLEGKQDPLCKQLSAQLNGCSYLLDQVLGTLQENPPILTNQGGIVRTGVNEDLDALNEIVFKGKDYLLQLQNKERHKTRISSLKIAYNKVFGYYLEVSNAHKAKVPATWLRKQTLVNAERYITEELKHYEEKIIHAEEQRTNIEQKIYQNLVAHAVTFIPQVQQNGRVLAQLDCYLSFAEEGRKQHYTQPIINGGKCIDLKGNRHPVIEQYLPLNTPYVPNDIYLDHEKQQIMVITGPNMAGKSALLRQVALTVLMAQIGAFVPAKHATIGYVDKIFTRVGAADNLAKGESTFMMEMTEAASIVHNLSDRSLLLMDEIGRGTSTYDGISIAWSLVEYLHNHPKFRPKTLFATHYHELNQLATTLPRVKNFNVAVKESQDKILFLHQLKPGGCAHSFGIHVAQIAGMPPVITQRASEVLACLAANKKDEKGEDRMSQLTINPCQLTLFDGDPTYKLVQAWLEQVDVNRLSPMEALLKINEWKDKLKK